MGPTSTNEESKQSRDVAGATLPSIRGLAADQRVSVITVQRAYESLEREGLIHSRRGKGFFISELHDHEKKDIASVSLAQNISPYIAAAIARVTNLFCHAGNLCVTLLDFSSLHVGGE